MIRPFTCACLLIAAGSGLYLYTVKHDAQMLDRETMRLSRQAQDSRARAALMRAEYDRLGDPDRLRELAGQVLTLQPTDPKQFASLAELDRRLPPVGPPPEDLPPQASAAPAEPARPVAAAPGPAAPDRIAERAADRPAAATPPRPAAPPAAMAAVAPIAAARAAQSQPAAPSTPAMQPASLLAMAQPAPRPPAPRPVPELRPTPLALPASRPAAPAPPAPRRAPAPAVEAPPASTAEVIARAARGAPIDTGSPMVASALGMARSMMTAPSPVSQANAQSLTTSSYNPGGVAQSVLSPVRR